MVPPLHARIMSKPEIEARIQEIENGPYFEVKLHAIPRVGDLINLWSFADQLSGHSPRHSYEVIEISHEIYDVPRDEPRYQDGAHTVIILVRSTLKRHK